MPIMLLSLGRQQKLRAWRVSDEDLCPALRGRQQFLPRNGQRVKEGLHRCFSIAPSSLMRARFVVRRHPNIEIILQLVDGSIDLLAERHTVELIEHVRWKRSQIPLVCGLLVLVRV